MKDDRERKRIAMQEEKEDKTNGENGGTLMFSMHISSDQNTTLLYQI